MMWKCDWHRVALFTPTCWQDTWMVWQCDWHRAALWHLHVDRTHGKWCDSVSVTGWHLDTYMLTGHMEGGVTVWLTQGGTHACVARTHGKWPTLTARPRGTWHEHLCTERTQKVVCDGGPHLVNHHLHTAMWSVVTDRVADTWHQYLHDASIGICVCACACSHVCMCMCVWDYACMRMFEPICMCVWVYACVCMCLSVCMYACVWVYTCVCVCVCVCVSLCMCACVWIYTCCVCMCACLKKMLQHNFSVKFHTLLN